MTDDPQAAALTAELGAAIAAGAGRRELGSGYQASVHVYTTSIGDVVVKTPHRGGPLSGLWRSLLRREQSVYARLGAIAGIPRSFGLVDGEQLALEYVAGPSLRDYEARIADREAFFAKLLATLEAMHAAGVAHGDLKRKDNIIVGPGEQPVSDRLRHRRAAQRDEQAVESLGVRAARADGHERVGQAQVRPAHRSRDGARRAFGRRRGDVPAL